MNKILEFLKEAELEEQRIKQEKELWDSITISILKRYSIRHKVSLDKTLYLFYNNPKLLFPPKTPPRYSYPPQFNNQLKSFIRKRDNYTCQLCGRIRKEQKRELSVHHITYNKKSYSRNKLITLCSKCNSRVNKNRREWKKHFLSKLIQQLPLSFY